MGVFDGIVAPTAAPKTQSTGGVFSAVPTPTAPSTGGVFANIKAPTAAAKPGVFAQQSTQTSPYFQAKMPSGTFLGISDEVDPYSGRPFLAYRLPGANSTTTDKTRTAPMINPEVPGPTTRSTFENPRMPQSASQAMRASQGATSDEQLDHRMALSLGGSNDSSNLKLIPTSENQAAGKGEGALSSEVAQGKVSLFQAQMQEAKAKGLPPPFIDQNTPPEKVATLNSMAHAPDNSVLGLIRNTVLGLPKAAATVGGAAVSTVKGVGQSLIDQYAHPSQLEQSMEQSMGAKLPAPIKSVNQAVLRTIEPMVEPLVTDATSALIFNQPQLYNAFVNHIKTSGANESDAALIDAVNKTPVQIVGDVAQAVLGAYAPDFVGSSLDKFAIKGFMPAMTSTVLHGVAAGMTFGTAQAASSGSKDPHEIGAIIMQNAVAGGMLSIATAGALHGTSVAVKPAVEAMRARLPQTLAEAQRGFVHIPGLGDLPEESSPDKPDLHQFVNRSDIVAERERQAALPHTHEIQTPEREAMRKQIVDEAYGTGAVNKNKRIDIVTGPPAAGKSSNVAEPLAKEHGSLLADSDAIKEKLPEFEKGRNAMAVHQESANLNKEVLDRALENGDNIVYPTVGEVHSRLSNFIDRAKAKGYEVHLHNVTLPPEKSVPRIITRFEETGRFVDPQYAVERVGLKPNEVHDIMHNDERLASATQYSTDVPKGEKPILLRRRGAVGGRAPEVQQRLDAGGNRPAPARVHGYAGERGRPVDLPAAKENLRDTYTRAATYKDYDGKTLTGEEALNRHLEEVKVGLELAEPGYRYATDESMGTEWHGVPSTFPSYLPEELRRSDLIEKLLASIENFDYPPKQNVRQRAFLDAVYEHLDDKMGIDTSKERETIKQLYDNPPKKAEGQKPQASVRGGAERNGTGKSAARAEEKEVKKPAPGTDPTVTLHNGGVEPPENKGGLTVPEIDWSQAKDKAAVRLSTDTMERNIEKIFPKEQADELNKWLIEPVRKNEADRAQFVTDLRREIKTEIVDKLGIKPATIKSALVQRFGEGRISLDELKKAAPHDWENIVKASEFFRTNYDDLLSRWNKARGEAGLKPITQRRNYFRHFIDLSSWARTYGFDFRQSNLPTAISGITEFFRSQTPWASAAMRRLGNETTDDAVGGMDNYLDSASRAIFHTDSVQRGRLIEKYLRGSATANENAAIDAREGLVDENGKEKTAPPPIKLPNFANNLNDWVNLVSGKQAKLDRAVEAVIGRPGLAFMRGLTRQFGLNVIGGNLSSAITHAIPLSFTLATVDKGAAFKGALDTLHAPFLADFNSIDGQRSDFLTRRFHEEHIVPTLGEKVASGLSAPFHWVEQFISRFAVAAKYYEMLTKGFSAEDAMKAADNYATRVIGDRSIGNLPNLMNTKTLGMITKFQIEVNDNIHVLTHDIPRWENHNALKIANRFVQFAVFSFLFNQLMQSIKGSGKGLDPIDMGLTLAGLNDEGHDKTLMERLSAAGSELLKELPFTSVPTGGQIPVIQPIVTAGTQAASGHPLQALEGVLASFASPVGGGQQLQKTLTGIQAWKQGYVTDASGKIIATVPPTIPALVQGAAFGPNAFGDVKKSKSEIQHLDATIKQQQQAAKLKDEQAANIYHQLKGMPKEEAAQQFDAILQEDPDMAKRIADLAKAVQSGTTKQDSLIKSLGVKNGQRAQYLAQQFNDMPTKEEKAQAWQHWVGIKLITPEVAQQLAPLLKK